MSSIVQIQNSLNAGEISPSLWGRMDIEKWHNGASTYRNYFVNYKGGAMSRPGFAYVGTCKQEYPDNPPRDIPFQFNINQGYVLEFGSQYMRVKYRGAYVTEGVNTYASAIEAYVGADTPVGYKSNGGQIAQDRDVSFIIQKESAPTTGAEGLKSFANDRTGAELNQATITDLGITGVGQDFTGYCLHPNGNFYFIDGAGTSNTVRVNVVNASSLTLLGTFGTAGSAVGSDSTHFAENFQMIPVVDGTTNYLISVGLASASHNNEVAAWTCTDTSLTFVDKAQTSEQYASLCEGERGTGIFYGIGTVNWGGGSSTPFGIYKGSVHGGTYSLTNLGSVSPSDIDPTWTQFFSVYGIGYDNLDGNLIGFAQPDAIGSTYKLFKVSSIDASVLWTLTVPAELGNSSAHIKLGQCYLNGFLFVWADSENQVWKIDLSNGTYTTTDWNTGIGGLDQFYDAQRDQIFMNTSGYTQSTGPIPDYFGVYLAANSDTIPSSRYMSIYPKALTGTADGYNITNITQANPAVITLDTVHNFSVGDWVYIYGAGGMTNFNGLTWIIKSIPNPYSIIVTGLLDRATPIDSRTFDSFTSNGIVSRIYELSTPYASEDLPYLKYTQSADVMTLTCVNPLTNTEYPPYSLKRLANDNWELTQDTFSSSILPPSNISITAQSSDTPSTWYSYVVTAVDSQTGEESVASDSVSIQNNDISISLGSNSLSWTGVVGAGSYNIYAATPCYSSQVPAASTFGYIGTSLGPAFTDNNITPDFTVVPPTHYDPFARGAVIDVPITSVGDGNFSQSTISWVVNTSTGSGFNGFPVVNNGFLNGFVITDQGSGYKDGDSITFTDSGGGLAKGNYLVTAQPVDGDHLSLNGNHTIEFKDPGSVRHPSYQVPIGATIPLTLQAVVNIYNADTNPSISCASYSFDDSHLYITYKTPGTAGNSYTLNGAPAGWTRSGPTLTGGGDKGSGASANLTIGPQSGTYPSVPAYFQQRRVYASSINKPDTYWMSQPGLFNNMDSSIPITSSDSITGTPWSQQVNAIQFMVPMPGGLVVLTGKSAWQINGGSSAAITPSDQSATAQAYNGCNNIVPPLPINYDILYVQSKGSIVRDLSYNFFTNIYTGTDITVFSNHLFDGYNILQWCWCEEPYKLVWALRNDGTLLCLTFVKEQEIYAWTRHDTNGLFKSVCSITEPPVDALYVITQRYIQGAWRYYSERLDNRIWNTVEQSFCVDAGVSYPVPAYSAGLAYNLTYPFGISGDPVIIPFPDANLTIVSSTGSSVQFSADADVFSSGQIGYIIRAGGGKATISSFVDSKTVICNITEPILDTIPNNSNNLPMPVLSGDWSLSPPTTTVTNLNHLEGESVSVLADGSVIEGLTVTNGSISLPYSNSLITIGLPFTSQIQTLYIDHPDQGNTAQNRRKMMQSAGIRVRYTRGLSIGADQPDQSTQQGNAPVVWSDMGEIKERNNLVYSGNAIPLWTGDFFKNVNSGWDVKGQIAIQNTYPLPSEIIAIITYWVLGDTVG